MKKFECLEQFLAVGFSYTNGAESAGLTSAKFRAIVFEELDVLSKTFGVSWHPLRHAHLKQQGNTMRELLERYKNSGTAKQDDGQVVIDDQICTYENGYS